jgi:hypothetical protein
MICGATPRLCRIGVALSQSALSISPKSIRASGRDSSTRCRSLAINRLRRAQQMTSVSKAVTAAPAL